MCLYVNCWTFQGYKLPVEQRINIRRIRTLPFFLFLVFKRYIYRLGVKFFLFSLSCFQKTYFKQTVSKILPFSFPCSQKTYLQTGSETLPFSFFLVFRRHIYKKEKKKNYSAFKFCLFPLFSEHIFTKKKKKEKEKPLAHSNSAATSRQNPFSFSCFPKTHIQRKTKTSCAFKFCRHVEAVERGPDELEAL